MKDHLRQLAQDTLIYGLSAVLSRGLNLLIVPLYVHALHPSEYGVATLITAGVLVMSMVVELGLNDGVGRFYFEADDDDLADHHRTFATAAWCQVAAAAALATVLLVLAEPIAYAVTGDSSTAGYFRLAVVAIPLTTLGTVLRTWLRFRRQAWKTGAVTMIVTATTLVLSLLLVGVLQWGLWGVFAATGLAQLVGSVACVALMRDWLNPRHFDRARAREMLRFGLPWVPGAIALWVIDLSDRLIIRLFGSDSDVAKYQLAYTLSAAASLFVQAVQPGWMPFALSIKDQPNARETYARLFSLYLAAGCAVAIAVSVVAEPAIAVIAPPFYGSAAGVVGILAVSYVVGGARTIAHTGTFFGGRSRAAAGAVIVGAAVNVALNFALVPWFGIEGAAAATLAAQAATVVLAFAVSQRQYRIPYRFGRAIALTGLAAALAVVRTEVTGASVLTDAAISVAVVVLLLTAIVATGAVSFRDAASFLRRRQA